MTKHLEKIAVKEDIALSPDAAERIAEHSEGDLRRAINTLQTSAANAEGTVGEEMVLRVIGETNPKQIQLMVTRALYGDFIEARKMMYNLMGQYGLSGKDLVRQIYRELFKVPNLSREEKIELANVIGEYDFRLTEGANDDIQLSALLAQFSKLATLKGRKVDS